jgi:ABC-type lipopolysaccharide export system ATPase subunit
MGGDLLARLATKRRLLRQGRSTSTRAQGATPREGVSGGERRLLEISRALVMEPDVFLSICLSRAPSK